MKEEYTCVYQNRKSTCEPDWDGTFATKLNTTSM